MKKRWKVCAAGLLLTTGLTLLLIARPSSAQEKAAGISAEDEKLLETLLRDFLFDPRGGERVRVTLQELTWYREAKEIKRDGWLVRDKAGDRIYFTDGDYIPAPPKEKISKVDFIAKCKILYKEDPDPQSGNRPDRFFLMLNGFEIFASSRKSEEEPDLVLAAWLYRFGKKDMAARVMQFVPKDRKEEVAILRESLARNALHKMFLFFSNYQDEAALSQGERLLGLYPAEVGENEQVRPLVEDLKRRKRQGTMGRKGEPELPREYAGWDTKKKLAFLLDSLDGIYHWGGTWGGIGQEEPHLAALIQLGEPAVPALIEAIAKDERMTRRVHSPSKWNPTPSVMPVRAELLSALRSILQVHYLAPRADEKSNTWETIPSLKFAAEVAREYWKEFGHLTYEERLMRVLTDLQTSMDAQREAVEKLTGKLDPDEKGYKPNPALWKFKEPTAAEAVLYTMERDLSRYDALAKEERGSSRWYLERAYFDALRRLGDRRIAPELAKWAEKDHSASMRARWAFVSYSLGQPRPLRRFADEFAAGKVVLPLDEESARWDLQLIIEHLSRTDVPEVDRALHKLAEVKHPLHSRTIKGFLESMIVYQSGRSYLGHPSGVSLLREILEDKASAHITYAFDGKALHYRAPGSMGTLYVVTPILMDPKKRKQKVEVRNCDVAGEKLTWLVAGLPEYHPLLNDADERLAAMKKALDRFAGRYRRLSPQEEKVLNDLRFAPDLPPLGRPATVEDVRTGKALFHLEGKGRLANLKLPAHGTWKIAANEKEARHGLIVQAEVGPDGEIIYGVIEPHALRMVPAGEFASVTSLPNSE